MSDSSKYSHLPLVPEAVLKKRHDLDDLVRKRKAIQEVDNNFNNGKSQKRILGTHFYVKKPESLIARSKSRDNSMIRYNRIKKKGMQKRASTKPIHITKEIIINNNTNNTSNTNTKDNNNDNTNEDSTSNSNTIIKHTYQSNSIGAKVVFVIRIRDHQGTPKSIKLLLNQLRLRTINDGVFVKYNEQTKLMLHTIEPWIVYGKLSTQVISDLIERRGYARIVTAVNDGTTKKNSTTNNNNTNTYKNKQNNNNNTIERIPLSDNTIIEEQLGTLYNIICKEDIVHEIDTVGINFDTVNNFLYPFKFINSKSYFEKQTLKLKDGKDYGDRGDEINIYIQQVL